MYKSIRKALCLSIFAIGLIIPIGFSGCGDDSNAEPGGSETAASGGASGDATKAKFIERADIICYHALADAEAGVIAYEEKNGLEPSMITSGSHPTKIAKIIIPHYQGEIDDLQALEAPEGDEESIDAVLASMQSTVDAARRDQSEFVTSWASGQNPFEEAADMAAAYGFTVCGGQPITAPPKGVTG